MKKSLKIINELAEKIKDDGMIFAHTIYIHIPKNNSKDTYMNIEGGKN